MSFISDILAAWDPLGGDERARCAHLPSYRWATCQRYSRIFWRSATALYHRAEVPPGAPSRLTALQPRAPAGLIAGSA